MLKNVFKIVIIFVVGMVGGIFADQIFWPYFIERPLFYKYDLDQQPINLTEESVIYIEENEALQEAALKVKNSIISVRTETKGGEVLEGSGLAVTSDGLIVTLNDLIPRGNDFLFSVEGKPASYEVLKRDEGMNLALVRLKSSNLSTVGFADLNQKQIGERVFLAGMLSDNETGSYYSVNEGIISSLQGNAVKTNILENEDMQGSSLFDIEGSLVGLVQIGPEGEVAAVPVSKIKEFIKI